MKRWERMRWRKGAGNIEEEKKHMGRRIRLKMERRSEIRG
jgi:hypothetical protein